MLNVPDILADVDMLLQDNTDGIFQFQNLLNTLRELGEEDSSPSPFQVSELFPPLLPLVFPAHALQIQTSWTDLPPLYGQRERVQKAILLLLSAIEGQFDYDAGLPLSLSTEENEEHLLLRISYPLSLRAQQEWSPTREEYLFVKRVAQEHQGSLESELQGEQCHISISFPLMFVDNEDSNPLPMAFELPAAIEGSGSPLELDAVPAEPVPHYAQPKPKRYELIFLSEDQRYLRSIRRLLSSRHEVFLASSRAGVLDQLSAHPDVHLVFCDLQGDPEVCLDLMDHIQTHDPRRLGQICFLPGSYLDRRVSELTRRLSNRCCHRHASLQELDEFIHRHAQFSLGSSVLPDIPTEPLSQDGLPSPTGSFEPIEEVSALPAALQALPQIPDEPEDDDE